MQDYEDIIYLPHHVSETHPRMSRLNRAAQFSPFAALTGYGAAIQEAGRLTDRKIQLDEDSQAVLDRKLAILREQLSKRPEVTVTYFQPDGKKDGGAYASFSGQVKKIQDYEQLLVFTDGTQIPFSDILDLDEEMFE